MFVSHGDFIMIGGVYYFDLVDSDFTERLQPITSSDHSLDTITPIVECYERRELNVPGNMALHYRWVESGMTAPLNFEKVMIGHPILHKYRHDIEKLLLLM
jgi:hypothetical protein